MVKFKYFKTLAVYNNNASTIANDDIVFIEDDNSLVTHGKTYKFSTPECEYVDLGLPSGTLWAKWNVGATSETDYGLYFQWGDTQGYNLDQIGTGSGQISILPENYVHGNGSDILVESNMTKYTSADNKIMLEPIDDAATYLFGNNWSTPTTEEFRELYNPSNCTMSFVTVNGINGCRFTSVRNGATLFIPASGMVYETTKENVGSSVRCWACYASAPGRWDLADTFMIGSTGVNNPTENHVYGESRWYALTIRAVKRGIQHTINTTGLLKGMSGGIISTAVAGTDYQAPLTAGVDYVVPVSGKGLSTNDFDNDAKHVVDNIPTVYVGSITSGNFTLYPNQFHSFGALTGALTVTLGTLASGVVTNIYSMEFDVTNTSYVPSFPSNIKWSSNITWAANKHYEVNIRYDVNTQKYYGIIVAFDKAT